TFTVTGTSPGSFGSSSATTLNAGGGNDMISVQGTNANGKGPLTVNAGEGNDSITIGGGGAGSLASGVSVNGNNGDDTLTINNLDSFPLITTSGAWNTTFDGGTGSDRLVVNNSSNTAVGDDGRSYYGINAVNVTDDAGDPAAVIFNATQRIGALNIPTGGKASLGSGGGKVLTLTSLSLSGSAQLDVNDEAIVYDYSGTTPASAVRSQLISGYAAGAWNGAGIDSSAAAANASHNTALGYGESSAILGSSG